MEVGCFFLGTLLSILLFSSQFYLLFFSAFIILPIITITSSFDRSSDILDNHIFLAYISYVSVCTKTYFFYFRQRIYRTFSSPEAVLFLEKVKFFLNFIYRLCAYSILHHFFFVTYIRHNDMHVILNLVISTFYLFTNLLFTYNLGNIFFLGSYSSVIIYSRRLIPRSFERLSRVRKFSKNFKAK